MTTAGGNDGGCIFCDHLAEGDDETGRILYRGDRTFVILNAFPYNTGHLMVAPFRHLGDICDLDDDERAELMKVTSQSVAIVREAMGAHGFNVGMNLGIVAGAGIPGHIHMHVVPRWGGDTNFMPVVGDTKVLPEMIEQTDAKLRPGFTALG
ncbi:MAG: HIT domain-containing protein [Actinomycetota bacterium]|nr:HIT domain-containing protein [Actinomycetota bacterium]